MRIVAAALCVLSVAIAGAQEYALTDLGPGAAYEINNRGDIVGVGIGANAVVWRSGQQFFLPDFGSTSVAYEINDKGQITGEAYNPAVPRNRAVLWPNFNTFVDLGVLPGGDFGYGSYGYGINESTQIAGVSSASQGTHGFLWTPGEGMIDIGTTQWRLSYAYGLNDRAEVTGQLVVGPETVSEAFIWRRGSGFTLLGQLEPNNSASGRAINEKSHVVGWGYATRDGASVYRAVYWATPGNPVDMGNVRPEFENSARAYDINESDYAVGASFRLSAFKSVFLWHPSTGMRNLQSLVRIGMPAGSYLWEAHGINDHGQIVGEWVVNNETRAYVLTPIKRAANGAKQSGDLATGH